MADSGETVKGGLFEADEKDLALLEELRSNSRLSEKNLSIKTGIPITTVHNRIGRMRDAGVILGYGVRLDHAKLGRPLTAFVLVKAAAQADQKELLEFVSKLPSVDEAAMVTGEFDVIFKARVATMDELNRMVVQGLRKNKAVLETRTMICYETREKS